MLQKLLQHQADQPPDLRQFRPELPEDVNRILRKMLAKDPRHRYCSPLELVNDLLWVARAAGLRPAAPGGRTWTVPTARGCSFLLSASAVDRFPAGLGGDCRGPGLSLGLHAGAGQSTVRSIGSRNGRRAAQCAAGCRPDAAGHSKLPSPDGLPPERAGGEGPSPVPRNQLRRHSQIRRSQTRFIPFCPAHQPPCGRCRPASAVPPTADAAAEQPSAEKSVIPARTGWRRFNPPVSKEAPTNLPGW